MGCCALPAASLLRDFGEIFPPGKGGPGREAAGEGGRKAGRNWQKDGVIRGMGMAEEAAACAPPPAANPPAWGLQKCVSPPKSSRAGLGSPQRGGQTPPHIPPAPPSPSEAPQRRGGAFLMPFSPNISQISPCRRGYPPPEQQHRLQNLYNTLPKIKKKI